MNGDLDTSIPDWIIEYPQTTDVFIFYLHGRMTRYS